MRNLGTVIIVSDDAHSKELSAEIAEAIKDYNKMLEENSE
jgi:hypothetical protein